MRKKECMPNQKYYLIDKNERIAYECYTSERHGEVKTKIPFETICSKIASNQLLFPDVLQTNKYIVMCEKQIAT